MKQMLLVLAVLVSLTGLSACGEETNARAQDQNSDGPPEVSDTLGSSGSPTTSIDHPTGADDVVLRIVVAGGFVPSDYAFTNQPRLVVLGDGTLLVADDSGRRPGRLANMLEGQLTETQLQELLALAQEADLLAAPPSYNPSNGNVVSDAPTTSVTITADGVTRVHDAYALGLGAGGGTSARKTLAGFVSDAMDRVASVDTAPYAPTRIRLQVTPLKERLPARSTEIDWPATDVDLQDPGECGVVTPADPAAVVEALAAADFATYFVQDEKDYSVSGRALLPGEATCAPDGADAPHGSGDSGDQPR